MKSIATPCNQRASTSFVECDEHGLFDQDGEFTILLSYNGFRC
jgi:hypothetical protein